MDTLISNASTTFANTVGFGLSAVNDFIADQVVVVLGFGLYLVNTNLGLILVILAISITCYILYRVFKWLHVV